jgi:hypothetical protein
MAMRRRYEIREYIDDDCDYTRWADRRRCIVDLYQDEIDACKDDYDHSEDRRDCIREVKRAFDLDDYDRDYLYDDYWRSGLWDYDLFDDLDLYYFQLHDLEDLYDYWDYDLVDPWVHFNHGGLYYYYWRF